MWFNTTIKANNYDIIFALMVFFSIYEPLTLKEFTNSTNELAERVAVGGIIVFRCLQFPFENSLFKTIKTWTHGNNRNPGVDYYAGIWQRIK